MIRKRLTIAGILGLVAPPPAVAPPPTPAPPRRRKRLTIAGIMGPVEPPPDDSPAYFDREMAQWLSPRLGITPQPARRKASPPSAQLVYTLVDADSDLLLSGPSGLAWRRYQFDCYAPAYGDSEVMNEALRRIFQNFKGPMGAITVTNVFRHRLGSGFTAAATNGDRGSNRITSEFTIWYREKVPRPLH